MAKIFIFIGVVFLAIIVLCSLATALTTSAASLANGVAMAQMANTLLTSQCLGVIMTLVALGGGLSIGLMAASRKGLTGNRRPRQARQLPAETGRRQIQQQPEVILLQDLPEGELVDDKLFDGWGWP